MKAKIIGWKPKNQRGRTVAEIIFRVQDGPLKSLKVKQVIPITHPRWNHYRLKWETKEPVDIPRGYLPTDLYHDKS